VGILVVFIGVLIWATIKGFNQFRTEHLLYPVTEGLILCVLLIIDRTITEFKIFVSLESGFSTSIYIGFGIFLITVFILALPKIRQDRTLMIFIITCGVLLILIICYIVLSIKFPNLFSHR
jgi:hypothetical protein